MKKTKKFKLENLNVQSFVTSLKLNDDEQKKIYGGTDRVWMCGPAGNDTDQCAPDTSDC